MKSFKIKSCAFILLIALSFSMFVPIMVSAASEPFTALEEAAGGKNLLMSPRYIDGGKGFNDSEGSASLLDYENENAKYCTNQLPYFAEWKYDTAYIADRILLRTGGDNSKYPRRMGDGWTLSGSNDGAAWTVIYTGSEDDVENLDSTYFYVDLPDNKTAYQYYKLNADETASDQTDTVIQLSMFVLCGNEPVVKTYQNLTEDPNKTYKIVSLGDSIPAYYGVTEEEGCVSQLSKLLNSKKIKNETVNLAKSGATTSDLLELLATNKAKAALKDADVVTVSIGGNNILAPLLNYIWDITTMVNHKYFTGTPSDNNIYFNSTNNQYSDLSDPFYASLSMSAIEKAFDLAMNDETMAVVTIALALFAVELDAIIAEITAIAPDADIYVSTVYNPVDKKLGVYEKINQVIEALNFFIIAGAQDTSYRVVDVASTFAASERNLTGFDLVKRMYNIHPNRNGHIEIAKLYCDAMTGKYVQPALNIPLETPAVEEAPAEEPAEASAVA